MTSLPSKPLRTVVAVIGTTGVGKSNLAIALAESLKTRDSEGVVLSADSMQIYKGLDVITNKITKEEMKGVRHWGLDMVKPGEGNWEMGRWCLEADREVGRAVTEMIKLIPDLQITRENTTDHMWWNALLCSTFLVPTR